MFCRSRFSRRAWRWAGVSGYAWDEAAGACGGNRCGTGALGDGVDKGAETGGASMIVRSGADTGNDSGSVPATSGEPALAELGDCVATEPGWPEA
ncbi:UNVERIFIED_ORG: hypothetical protein ABIB19_000660 [Arthrobacter sp. UYEF10]